jgi:hypothetical protein
MLAPCWILPWEARARQEETLVPQALEAEVVARLYGKTPHASYFSPRAEEAVVEAQECSITRAATQQVSIHRQEQVKEATVRQRQSATAPSAAFLTTEAVVAEEDGCPAATLQAVPARDSGALVHRALAGAQAASTLHCAEPYQEEAVVSVAEEAVELKAAGQEGAIPAGTAVSEVTGASKGAQAAHHSSILRCLSRRVPLTVPRSIPAMDLSR